jgi:hypothetical protein
MVSKNERANLRELLDFDLDFQEILDFKAQQPEFEVFENLRKDKIGKDLGL